MLVIDRDLTGGPHGDFWQLDTGEWVALRYVVPAWPSAGPRRHELSLCGPRLFAAPRAQQIAVIAAVAEFEAAHGRPWVIVPAA